MPHRLANRGPVFIPDYRILCDWRYLDDITSLVFNYLYMSYVYGWSPSRGTLIVLELLTIRL